MARRTTHKVEKVFGENVTMKEQYYLGNAALPTSASQYEYTPQMISAMKRSMTDIHYFAENFFTIINKDRKRVHIELRPYQNRILKTMRDENRVIMLTSRQIGKCVSSDTKITVRHKITKVIMEIEIGRFFNIQKNSGIKPIPTNSLKFIERYNASKWQVKSDQGWSNIKSINKTIPYERFTVTFESGKKLLCADNHILITAGKKEIFAKDAKGQYILTENGPDKVLRIEPTFITENMYDLELSNNTNHLYYTNGVLSHNTTLMTIYALWLANFHPDQLIIILANKKEMAKEIFGRIKLAYMELPNWLKEPVDGEWNEMSAKFTNGSRIITEATTKDAIRGQSAPSCIILDEFAFVDDAIAKPFWATVMPTVSTSPNSKVFISTTANGKDNHFYDMVQRVLNKKSEFKLEYVYWYDVPGRDEEWKKKTIETDLNGDAEMFEQEYECKFLGAHSSPFPAYVFEQLEKDIKPPIEILYDGALSIWRRPELNRVYSMSVDVAEGIGKDASVIQIFDLTNLENIEQVAMYYSNTIDPTAFVPIIMRIAELYGFPVLSVERNGIGAEVCNRLYMDNNYPHFVSYGTTGSRFRPGITSNTNSKSMGVLNMKTWLTKSPAVHIHDRRFSEELSHFQKKTNNVWAAERGYHDDVVMSVVWALNVLHRSIVETYYIVDRWTPNKLPAIIHNKFLYKIDPNFISENMHEDIAGYTHIPALLYGRGTFSVRDRSMYDIKVEEATKEELELAGWREI